MAKQPQKKLVAKKTVEPAGLRKLREQVESRRLRLEDSRLQKQEQLLESVTDSVFGTPIPFEQIYSYQGKPLIPLFFRDFYQSKPTTLRILQDIDRQRQLARYAYETNPNAQAVINGMSGYVVAGGYDAVVSPKKKQGGAVKLTDAADDSQTLSVKAETEKAQAIIDEFVETNELKDAADGCSGYDEAFNRSHVEGECFVRLFADEIDTTRLRFLEPDNIRPPHGQNWEGPWSFGVLTAGQTRDGGYGDNLAWDTQTPRAYNLNYPLVDRDEQVAPQFIFHLKMNVKKNQKRGVSSLYSVDEDLRGTQKLRYAAREGAKIRASIPYVREHEQADVSSISELQQSVITATAPRSDQWGGQYDVGIQQIEPGSVQDIPQSMKMQPAPSDPNYEAVERNLRHGIETIAARFNAPAWLVGGAGGDASYADGLVKESPFYRTLIRQQAKQTGFWRRIFLAVLEIAVEQGRLPEGATERLHITVTAQDPQVRNESERATMNKTLHDEGVISLHTWTTESGHDFDEEQAERKKEEAAGNVPKPQEPVEQQGGGQGPQTIGGMRQREEGLAEAAVAGYAIGLAEQAAANSE